tara:strand:+ start:7191 stop:7481 length:291 start_codon:yes stop_codon:yes gene_type:complete
MSLLEKLKLSFLDSKKTFKGISISSLNESLANGTKVIDIIALKITDCFEFLLSFFLGLTFIIAGVLLVVPYNLIKALYHFTLKPILRLNKINRFNK